MLYTVSIPVSLLTQSYEPESQTSTTGMLTVLINSTTTLVASSIWITWTRVANDLWFISKYLLYFNTRSDVTSFVPVLINVAQDDTCTIHSDKIGFTHHSFQGWNIGKGLRGIVLDSWCYIKLWLRISFQLDY